jgi:hypothetical protein
MESIPKPLDRQFREARARRPRWIDAAGAGAGFGFTMALFTIANDLYERAGLGLQPPVRHISGPFSYALWFAFYVVYGAAIGLVFAALIRLWRRFWLFFR